MDPSMDVAKYKMLRFFDFNVDPSKKYRYRVQVLIEDPNHPREAEYTPDPRTVANTVAQRVRTIDEADAAKNGARTFWRETEWSEPSDIVTLPAAERFLGGEVLAGRQIEMRDLKISVPIDEPSATVIPVIWDLARAVEVAGNPDIPEDPKATPKPSAYRGTVLTFQKDANVLRPDTLEVKMIEKHKFRTGAIVVDLRPGEPLRDGPRKAGETKEPLKSSGEVLILDRHGNFVVRNELDDDDDMRRLLFLGEEKPDPAAGGGMMPGMAPGMGPGMAPGMAPPGAPGKGPGRGADAF